MAGVDVFSMRNVHSLIMFPPDSESFAISRSSRRLIELLHLVCARGWVLFGIPEHNFRDRLPVSLAESA